ncbi:class I SAM-dependent methyltransferase [Pantoea vagans]|uniref:class I SAM-dependent methyltransferase n=1 Tax=Pantoea vagans TaxID=470934 RepID=UPI0023AFC733|nr:class I SAM-dependent methyltransferase [Pantoea vagans]MDE8556368.1 class I SAM-dependent methyltransferase [Pantoea vagans]MDE8576419.1 class I SAM-dependent methyltransferase [Pantoea vagans]
MAASSTGRQPVLSNEDYYRQNAQRFFTETASVDMSALYPHFVSCLPPGARILDAGCGSGRDVKAFGEMGFAVEAFDASAELVALACQLSGKPVTQMRFQDVNAVEKYDGIWCCASLLHVSDAELPEVMTKLAIAMKPDGIWYLSFKYGRGEREKDGRRFTDMDVAGLQKLVAGINTLVSNILAKTTIGIREEAGSEDATGNRFALETTKIWQNGDVRIGRGDEVWLNAIIRKKII